MRISVIIVSYNSKDYITECLDSVFNQSFSDYEVILIDNGSTDSTLDLLGSYKSMISLKVNSNAGFPKAVNDGISMSKGDYVLVLNPDVVLHQNCLREINRAINNAGKSIGMIGIKILKKDSMDRLIDSAGLYLSNMVRFHDRGHGEKDIGQYDNIHQILGPCAAAGFYKRSMLEDLKIEGEYFDKDFFYLIEDFDVAFRAKRRGWKGIFVPDAICYHVRNGCSTSCSYRQYMSFRNRYFFIIKNIEITPFFILCFLVYDLPRLGFLLLINPYALKAIKEIKQYLPIMLEKRRKISLKKGR